MKKNTIWIIIALMALALLGIIVLQSSWIMWSIRLNEEKINKEVFSALTHVERRLGETENAVDIVGENLRKEGMTSLEQYLKSKFEEDSASIPAHWASILSSSNDENSPFQQKLALYESLQLSNFLKPDKKLIERIDLKKLDTYLQQELLQRGIDLDYHYGVWSNERNSFVILDGNYVVEEVDTASYSTVMGNESLLNSQYKSALFETDDYIPGYLMIEFRSRNRIVFRDLWPTIVASILFTGIILFCFAYTILIIFRQKKISEIKNDFINNMTHEFKTPIATINLAADSITSPMVSKSSEKINRFAQIIKQENHRMLNQVEKVLQLAQLEKRQINLKITQLDLHDIIREAVSHAYLQVEKEDGIIRMDLDADHSIIDVDQNHVSNIIHNLLENATKYSEGPPDITVTTKNKNKGLEVRITDKGIGMTDEQQKQIFDKFYRVPTGNVHNVKGFGLGLSYVKTMMQAHKGSVKVKSKPGMGSTFILFFPPDVVHEKEVNVVIS